ncbi:trem-like transcript 4 protein isoform X1 [Sigmodon hispidus]
MAWACSQLWLASALLLLLTSGVWGSTVVPEEFHRVVGENLSVRCQYTPEAGRYVPKSWCRQTSPSKCNRVVTTSGPRRAHKESQHTIWDDPEAGFFSITVTQLTKQNSAFYWCGLYDPSRNVISTIRNISLVVSPAASTLPPEMTTWLPTSTVLITSPAETTGSFINGFEHRNQTASSDWVSPRLLVFVQYGLLLLKGLMLSIFCVILCRRRCQGHTYVTETAVMEATEYASLSDVSKSLGKSITRCEKNDYSLNPTQ